VESHWDRNSTILLAEAHTGAVPLIRSSIILPHFFVNINGRQGLTPVPVAQVTPFHTQIVNNDEGKGRPFDLFRQKLTVLPTVTLLATLFAQRTPASPKLGYNRKTPSYNLCAIHPSSEVHEPH